MLINSTLRTDKFDILSQFYVRLVNSGVSTDEILVLCLNSNKKQKFIQCIQDKISVNNLGKYNIYTFLGLCYNAVLNNWVLLESGIKSGEASILPNLCGLELSERLLLKSIGKDDFCDYFSKMNLLHQMFKRMQIIVLNGLSDSEIASRADILGETFSEDAMRVYNKFRSLTLRYRSFDYMRQLSMLQYIFDNTEYFSKIKYLIIDDADEITFSEWKFLKSLKFQLKDWCIAYDGRGSSRAGYLCAYKNIVNEINDVFGEKSIETQNFDKQTLMAEELFNNILAKKKSCFDNFTSEFFLNRLDMLDSAFGKINFLLKNGAKASDILIVTPICDDMLKSFSEEFFSLGVECQFISGSKKPKDVPLLKNIFTILKIIHCDWGLKIEAYEFRNLFFDCLSIPFKYSKSAVNLCSEENNLVEVVFEEEKFQKRYNDLLIFIRSFYDVKTSLSSELLKIFDYIAKNGVTKDDLKYFNFLLKQVRSFEKAFGKLDEKICREIIVQLENSVISDNPAVAEEIKQDAVIFSTPQKVIDFEIRRKYHFWLDISSDLWLMRDIGVLYNAWVFNAEFSGNKFDADDNEALSRDKSARVLRKLFMCCENELFAYYSKYDSSGSENTGFMYKYFGESAQNKSSKENFKIIPREDQKQVIEYTGGMAAVNAVPGAGKTTVLIALLIKLMQNNIKHNNILVLTYMESAASNIREKIKLAFPNSDDIPDISTIHGLAFRIIKENNNFVRLNFTDSVEIADDNTQQKFLMESIVELGLDYNNSSDYQSGISAVKLSPNGISSLANLKNSMSFEKVFNLYEKKLHSANMIDYDDMLRYAVQLVEKNDDLREYYSSLYHYVIEDEAQDSSELQQKLLLLLSSKHHNLLRIGDINQAITSSFTDSDPKCFKKFFEQNNQMVIKSSQRSSVQIQKLANNLIEYSKTLEDLKDTFYDSKLTQTEYNPISDKNPVFKIFDDLQEEQFFVLNKIRELSKNQKKYSIAILLRNNNQILYWKEFLAKQGLSVTVRNDIPGEKNVFKVIFAFLKFLQTPFSNKCVKALMRVFHDCRIIKFAESDYDFISSLKQPFIKLNGDNLSEALARLWWELAFCDELAYISLEDAAVKIGMRYFSLKNEKSNVFLVSLLIKRLSMLYNLRETVMDKLEKIAVKPIGNAFKFFEDENDKSSCCVNLLTMHKSKGDEFDIVFIPEMNDDNYTLDLDRIKVKTSLSEQIKQLRTGYIEKSSFDIKKEIAEETLRLLYVGFTRAKIELYVSCSKEDKFKKLRTPSELFYVFGNEAE